MKPSCHSKANSRTFAMVPAALPAWLADFFSSVSKVALFGARVIWRFRILPAFAAKPPAKGAETHAFIEGRHFSGRFAAGLFLAVLAGVVFPAVLQAQSNMASVVGVRQNGDLLVALATNSLAGAAWSLTYSNATWNISLVSSNSSHRGIGTNGLIPSRIDRDASIRLLDVGGIEVIGGDFEASKDGIVLPTNAIPNPATGKWHFNTLQMATWDEAQNYFTNYHGSLVTISSEEENNWLVANFRTKWVDDNGWIGLYWRYEGWRYVPYWISGEQGGYRAVVDQPHYQVRWDYQGATTPPITILRAGVTEFWGSNVWYVIEQERGPRIGIGQVRPPVETYTNRWLIPEPPATNRIVWRGARLRSGQPRPGIANHSSIFHCFVDDRNVSGEVDASDAFVLAEYDISGNTVVTATLTNIPVGSGVLAQSFGLAAVDFLNTSADYIFSAELNGGIYSWSPSGTSSPLQRQVFTEDYLGKGWHALTEVKMAPGGGGLVGLLVDPANPSKCKVMFWAPQTVLSSPQSGVVQTAPLARILPEPALGHGMAVVSVRVWDAEGNNSQLFLQYSNAATAGWSNATVVSIDGAAPSHVQALPTGTTHQAVWNAVKDLVIGYTNDLYLRVRAQDFSLAGDWSEPAMYRVEISPDNNPPLVNLVQPVDHTVFNANQTIVIEAFASDLDGEVLKVEFLANSNLLETVRSEPYLLSWTNLALGRYALQAVATDDLGATAVSPVVGITVNPVGLWILDPAALSANRLRFELAGFDGERYRIDSSTNLITWTTNVATVTNINGRAEFSELLSPQIHSKYYRAVKAD